MTVTPAHDPNTFWVSSQSGGDDHLVDLETMECGCPPALEFNTTSPQAPCAHVEAAIQYKAGVTPHRAVSGSIIALLMKTKTP